MIKPMAQPKNDDDKKKEWHRSALELYKSEISTISESNAAFLIVQSILIAALSTFLVLTQALPYALIFFVLAIATAGSLFCFFHHRAGKSSANTALQWKRYMCFLEGKTKTNSPWKKFHSYLDQKERRSAQRMPLKHAWITNPGIFAVGWFLVALYITIRLFFPDDPIVVYLTSIAEFLNLC